MSWLRALTCAAAVLAAGCGGDGPVAPTRPEHPYDGNWVGKFVGGQEVFIKIEASRVTLFETVIEVSSTCGFGITQRPNAPIVGQEFTFNMNDSFLSNAPITGRFETDRRMTGTLAALTTVRRQCGVDPPVSLFARTFTAEQ